MEVAELGLARTPGAKGWVEAKLGRRARARDVAEAVWTKWRRVVVDFMIFPVSAYHSGSSLGEVPAAFGRLRRRIEGWMVSGFP